MPELSPARIKQQLRESYRTIAGDFSETRSHHWPEFHFFKDFIPPGVKVLELGCGNGRFFGFLEEQQKQVDYTGVDFCPELLEIAKKKYPSQDFIEQDMTELALSRQFDRIVSIAAFHHIPSLKLRRSTLRLIAEHLTDDGILLLSVWNLWQWRYALPLLKGFLRSLGSFFRTDPRDVFVPFGKKKVQRYYHAFLLSELKRLLRRSGFLIEQSKVSGHNFLLVCRKNMVVGVGNPLFVEGKKFAQRWHKSSAAASSHFSRGE